MGWDKIEHKYCELYSRDFVSLNHQREKDFLVDLIIGEFPGLNRFAVLRAIDQCYFNRKVPTVRSQFFKCLSSRLGM